MAEGLPSNRQEVDDRKMEEIHDDKVQSEKGSSSNESTKKSNYGRSRGRGTNRSRNQQYRHYNEYHGRNSSQDWRSREWEGHNSYSRGRGPGRKYRGGGRSFVQKKLPPSQDQIGGVDHVVTETESIKKTPPYGSLMDGGSRPNAHTKVIIIKQSDITNPATSSSSNSANRRTAKPKHGGGPPKHYPYRNEGRRKVVPTIQSNELAQELTAGTYECMVCCEKIRDRHEIWGCPCCYNLFHLKCISRWAKSPAAAVNEGI